MKQMPLGRTGLTVPQICLGTMTWGNQNTQAEGFEQMDYALDQGVNFLDTAEIYATVPASAETYGKTEEIIGNWFAARGNRDRVILASKVAGGGSAWVRGGAAVDAANIRIALDQSLRRLQTDYIDLYQIHWPPRGHYHFRRQWAYDPSGQDTAQVRQTVADILGELGRQVDAGKIRHVGLSNETVWGTMEYLRQAEAEGLPRVATIQNEYSLLYRTFDLDLAEMSHHEDVGLLAYSPLAGGILTGKYSDGTAPRGSRGDREPRIGGRRTDEAVSAAQDYVNLAREHGLDPATMAIAFCMTRPFMTSVIIGATSMDQLRKAIAAKDVTLSDDLLESVAALHRKWPAPY